MDRIDRQLQAWAARVRREGGEHVLFPHGGCVYHAGFIVMPDWTDAAVIAECTNALTNPEPLTPEELLVRRLLGTDSYQHRCERWIPIDCRDFTDRVRWRLYIEQRARASFADCVI